MGVLNFSDVVGNFQKGANWAQDFRANRQLEQARGLAVEDADYQMQAKRAARKVRDPISEGVLGALDPNDPSAIESTAGMLEDPFAFKLANWFSGKLKKRRAPPRTAALDTGTESAPAASNPVGPIEPEAMAYGDPTTPYADGGKVRGSSQMIDDEDMKRRAADNRARTREPVRGTESVQGADRTQPKPRAVSAEAAPAKPQGLARRAINSGAGRLGAGAALATTALDTATTDTEQYRKRFGLETDDPSFLGDVGVRALGAASDLGNALTFGMAGKLYRDRQEPAAEGAPVIEDAPLYEEEPVAAATGGGGSYVGGSSSRRAALPTARTPAAEQINLADIDVDPREIPDMKMGDWVRYRAQVMDAARRSGDPDAVAKADQQVTAMQQRGFTSYLQQGLSMQQAGNVKGAMAAYRAAYQYFPNGRDVEFGVHKGQIVGFGRDEQTGKPAEGGRPMLMDPERVAVLIENFSNPQAFRMWTKDWREFQAGERRYEEVTKPLAQAQADAYATNSEANVLRAENAGLRAGMAGGAGGYKQSDMRGDAAFFQKATEDLALDPTKAKDVGYLQAVMGVMKQRFPDTPPAMIAQRIRQAYEDGTLPQKLSQLGVRVGGSGPGPSTPPRAIPPTEDVMSDEEQAYYDNLPAR